ncbi:MAG: energy transducer TonB [Proteobacteria bacterium]|nr:energy transducer TonB [Pseudomonadota bacterium]
MRTRFPIAGLLIVVLLLLVSCAGGGQGRYVDSEACAKSASGEESWSRVRIAPRYPIDAARKGITGFVVMEFTLTPEGKPREIQVVESKPPGVFDSFAVEALREWRYCPTGEAHPGVRVQIDFALD